jgi:hypothetical protein
MKRSTLISLLCLAFIGYVFLTSSSNGRATAANSGNTGAPLETQTCGNCHSGGAYGPVTISIQVFTLGTTNPVTSYVPGQQYDLRVTVNKNAGTPGGYGFQLTCLTLANNTPLAGYSNLATNVKQKLVTTGTFAGRTYTEHNGVGTNNIFNMRWTAPAAGTGSVRFYSSGNAVNGTGSTGGDNGGFSNLTLTEAVALTASGFSTNPSCNNGTDGAINIEVSGGSSPYTFLWNDGNTAEDRTNLTAGNYSVTITDNAGGSTVLNYTLTNPAPVTLNSSSANATFFNADNGEFTVTVGGGSGFYQFGINGAFVNVGPGSYTYENLGPGSYLIDVIDSEGCAQSQTVVITEPDDITITQSVTNLICAGEQNGSIFINTFGGTPPYTFEWNDGVLADNRINLSGGTYTVTITDSQDYSRSFEFSVIEPTPITFNINTSEVLCFGGTANIIAEITGGTEPYNANIPSSLPAGDYIFVVSDNNGCETEYSFGISQPEPFLVTSSAEPISCTGGNSTVVFQATGGTQPYISDLSPASVSNPGQVTYVFLDANNCEATTIANIEALDGFTFESIVTTTACVGDCNGTIEGFSIDATTPITITWDNGTTGEVLTDLCSGIYTATISDEAGCTITHVATVTEPTPVDINFAFNSILCNGGETEVTLNANGGTGNITLLMNEMPFNGGMLAAGTYSITAIDESLCQTTEQFTITEPTALTYEVLQLIESGAQAGTVEVSGNGGTAPYNYQWTTGANTGLVILPFNEEHSVTITDDNGCTIQTEVFNIIVGIEELLNNSLSVYPNPMTTELSFGFENKNQEYAWTIKSSQGQTIFSNQSKQFEKIDVSQLSAGVYFLEIELGNQKVTKRLVKQ